MGSSGSNGGGSALAVAPAAFSLDLLAVVALAVYRTESLSQLRLF